MYDHMYVLFVCQTQVQCLLCNKYVDIICISVYMFIFLFYKTIVFLNERSLQINVIFAHVGEWCNPVWTLLNTNWKSLKVSRHVDLQFDQAKQESIHWSPTVMTSSGAFFHHMEMSRQCVVVHKFIRNRHHDTMTSNLKLNIQTSS